MLAPLGSVIVRCIILNSHVRWLLLLLIFIVVVEAVLLFDFVEINIYCFVFFGAVHIARILLRTVIGQHPPLILFQIIHDLSFLWRLRSLGIAAVFPVIVRERLSLRLRAIPILIKVNGIPERLLLGRVRATGLISRCIIVLCVLLVLTNLTECRTISVPSLLLGL